MNYNISLNVMKLKVNTFLYFIFCLLHLLLRAGSPRDFDGGYTATVMLKKPSFTSK